MENTKICLTGDEWRVVIQCLNALKTKLHSEGQDTDAVDDALYKVITAKAKWLKIAG